MQNPYQFGFKAVKLMAKLAKGDRSEVPANGIIYEPHRVITSENVDAFYAELKKLRGM